MGSSQEVALDGAEKTLVTSVSGDCIMTSLPVALKVAGGLC